MFTQEAIKEIQQAHATTAISDAVHAAYNHQAATVFTPEDFTRHDLEKLLPHRRRARGGVDDERRGAALHPVQSRLRCVSLIRSEGHLTPQ